MAQIFPIDFSEKTTIAQNDYILFSDSEDGNKIKKAQYSNLKGEQGNPGEAATITVGSTTTGAAGSSASVVNSGTTSAAVLDFTIPKGDKGDPGNTGASVTSAAFNGNDIDFGLSDGTTVTLEDAKVDLKGDTGDAATITVGTTTTGEPGTNASVTNSGTSAAAVFNFTIPKGAKGDPGETGSSATISVGTTTTGDAGTSASVTNSGTSSAAVFNFTIPKGDKGDTGAPGADGQDGADGAAATITVGSTTTGNPGTNASVVNSGTSSAAVFDFTIPQGATGATGNGIASVTSSKSGKITTVTITETDGDDYSFQISDGADGQGAGDVVGPASSTDGDVVVFDGSSGKLIRDGSVSLSTLSAGASAGATAVQPGDLGTAASKNTGTSSGNVPVLDSNGKLATSTLPGVALTDTYTVTNKSDLTSLSSAEQGDIGIVTSESKTYVLSQSPYSTAANWKELLTPTDSVTSVNGQTGAVTLDADDISDSTTTNKFVTATEKSTWNGKQNALSTQTAYTSKGTSTKVPTITTNTLGQVTGITETSIAFPVTSVNGSTGAVSLSIPTKTSDLNNDSGFLTSSTGVTSVNGSTGSVTVNGFNPGGTATTGYVLKKTADGYGWDAESGAVTSVNGQTGAVTVSEFTPTSAGSTDQVLTKTAGGYDWATPAASGIVCDPSSPITIDKIRVGTESDYSNLGTYSSTTAYMTI